MDAWQITDESRHAERVNAPRFDPANGVKTVNDPRGLIESLCHDPVASVIRIESHAGSIRSNHYHLTDWHVCYVVKGGMHWYERHAGSKEKPEHRFIGSGEYVRTGPMVEHTSVFPVDTVLLVFAGNPRDQDNYERDLVHTDDLSAL